MILVDPPPLRQEPGAGGKAVVAYSANGRRPYAALRVDGAPAGASGLAFRVEGDGAVGASPRTPDYVLGNTGSRTWNLGASVGHLRKDGGVRASWHHYQFLGGVFYGLRNATPAEFRAQLEAGVPVTADLWSTSAAIDRPYQDVSHDLGVLHGDRAGPAGRVDATYAFQYNHRRE